MRPFASHSSPRPNGHTNLNRRFGDLKDRTAFKEVDHCQQMVKEYSGAIQETAEQNS